MHTAHVDNPMTSNRPTAANGESKPAKTVRILIGGDYWSHRDSLARLVRKRADFDLAGVVSSDEIVPALANLKPGVAVLGPFKPGRKREAEILSSTTGHVRVVFASTETEPTIYDAIALGAMGYLTSAATPQEILGILDGVAMGQSRFSSDAQDALACEVRKRTRAARPSLTPKEREVLRLMGEGLDSVEIGKRLYITKSTVKTHQHNIYRKLEVHSGKAAVVAAARQWLI
jgi:DNA-binding NarL/FixJ family response regulator